MAVNFEVILKELQGQASERKKLELERSPLGAMAERKFAEVERLRIKVERNQTDMQRQYFSNQREKQAALRSIKQQLDELQALTADAGTTHAEMAIADIENTLQDTLARDDHVDLDDLKKKDKFHEFSSENLVETPKPSPIKAGPEPKIRVVAKPSGLQGLLGGKKKYERNLAQAQEDYQTAHRKWEAQKERIPVLQLEQMQEYQRVEAKRLKALQRDRNKYDQEKSRFDSSISAYNRVIDDFKQRYEAGEEEAVGTYLNLVFARSLYPNDLPLNLTHNYDSASHELRLQVTFPDVADMPSVKGYRYVKSKGEIQEVKASQKETKDRYTGLIQNLALRLLHEVWESDRPRHIQTVSLSGWVDHVDGATGRDAHTQVLAVAVDRKTFEGIDLSRATPSDSLKYLGAVVSKDPAGYAPVLDQYGVRGR